MNRGEVYDARLVPVEGSEQGGTRPVVVVSRDAIHHYSAIALIIPFTTARPNRRLYPSHVLIQAPEGGLTSDSIALAEQCRVLSQTRLVRLRGALSPNPWPKSPKPSPSPSTSINFLSVLLIRVHPWLDSSS
jgi:mRNA interferase MazF